MFLTWDTLYEANKTTILGIITKKKNRTIDVDVKKLM